MAEKEKRFASLSEDEIGKLVEDKDSANTKRATNLSVRVFENYLTEKQIPQPVEKEKLASVIKSFYVEARKVDGSPYSKSSLASLRFGLNRYFKNLHGIDIINDPDFKEANKVFLAKCVELKKQGLAKVDHKQPIHYEDMKKLYEGDIFDTSYPKTLQNKVFFEIMLYFCRRGRQNLRELKKSDFTINIDAKGNKYVTKTTDEMTKNRRENDEGKEGGIMFAKDGPFCPVASFEKYLQRLNPKNEYLFQRPKKYVTEYDNVWFDNMVVSERSLGEKMKIISKKGNLSSIYTNHSIRATAVTILDKAGFEARHIMALSGHKSESSIRSYSRTSLDTKRDMSQALMAVASTSTNVDTPSSPQAQFLSLSQEETHVNIQASHSQFTKQFNFYNCSVKFD